MARLIRQVRLHYFKARAARRAALTYQNAQNTVKKARPPLSTDPQQRTARKAPIGIESLRDAAAY